MAINIMDHTKDFYQLKQDLEEGYDVGNIRLSNGAELIKDCLVLIADRLDVIALQLTELNGILSQEHLY